MRNYSEILTGGNDLSDLSTNQVLAIYGIVIATSMSVASVLIPDLSKYDRPARGKSDWYQEYKKSIGEVDED